MVRMWRRTAAGTLAPAGALAPGGGSVFSLSAHACTDGSAILAAGTFSRVLHAWRVAATEGGDARVVETLLTSREHTGWVRATAVADEHSCCSIGCNRLLAWRLPGGPPPDLPERELPLYEEATATDQAAQRSHDILSIGWRNGVLAAGSVDGALRCWRGDAATEPAAVLTRRPAHWLGHSDRVAAVALAADGALLSAGYDGAVRAWCAPDGPELGAGWELSHEARLPSGRPIALAVGGARVQPPCGENRLAGATARRPGLLWLALSAPGCAAHSGRATEPLRAPWQAVVRPKGPAEVAASAASNTQVHCSTSDGEVRSLDAASLELATEPMRMTQGTRATAVAVLGTDTLVAGDSSGMLHLGHDPC